MSTKKVRFSYGDVVKTNSENVIKKYRNKVLTVNHHFKDDRVLLVSDDGKRIGVHVSEVFYA